MTSNRCGSCNRTLHAQRDDSHNKTLHAQQDASCTTSELHRTILHAQQGASCTTRRFTQQDASCTARRFMHNEQTPLDDSSCTTRRFMHNETILHTQQASCTTRRFMHDELLTFGTMRGSGKVDCFVSENSKAPLQGCERVFWCKVWTSCQALRNRLEVPSVDPKALLSSNGDRSTGTRCASANIQECVRQECPRMARNSKEELGGCCLDGCRVATLMLPFFDVDCVALSWTTS